MPVQQPVSPLDKIKNLQPAAQQQKKLEERLSWDYVPKARAQAIQQRLDAARMRNRLFF